MNDLAQISEPLRRLSASDREIVLPYDEARLALDELADRGIAVPAWEGWLIRFDGTKHHSRRFQGTAVLDRKHDQAWEDYVDQCRTFTLETMTEDHARFPASAESAEGTLFFCFYLRAGANPSLPSRVR